MAEKTHLKKWRCHLRCFAQLMRNASARFATAKRPCENNVIATDRSDRCHLILSSNAVSVAGQRKIGDRPHMVWETIKVCYPSPEQDGSVPHLGDVQIWSQFLEPVSYTFQKRERLQDPEGSCSAPSKGCDSKSFSYKTHLSDYIFPSVLVAPW